MELQQVAVKGGIVSADHTHATVKNIYGVGGAGISAIFDVCDNTTGETATGVCVSSTAAGAYAHAASSLSHARGATIKVCFTDNWPTSQEVLEALWGISHGRLDIFHWMRRLSVMLHDTHCDYYRALALLSQCVYYWNDDDMAGVTRALKDGSLNGKRHSLSRSKRCRMMAPSITSTLNTSKRQYGKKKRSGKRWTASLKCYLETLTTAPAARWQSAEFMKFTSAR